MKTIVYKNTGYRLVSDINVDLTRLQATIYKDENSLDDIVADVTTNESIKIYEDEEQIAIYNGYHTLLAVAVYDDNNERVVSIEMLNTDLQTQLNGLGARVDTVDSKVSTLEASQDNQDESLATLEEGQTNTEVALAEVYEMIV